MKVTIDIECTPEEARTFLGLPDLQPMQQALLTQVQERIGANMAAMDPEALFKTWLPVGWQNVEALQRFFWSNVMGAGSSSSRDSDET